MRNTLEELTRENATHIDTHGPLTEQFVDVINNLSDLIEKNRDSSPVIGDSVEVFTRDGRYFPNAHIESISPDGFATVCLSGGLALVDYKGKMSKVSGGPFESININDMSPNGEYVKCFQYFRPATFVPADAMVIFKAKVKRWRYKELNPIYGDFSEKEYNLYYHYERPMETVKLHGGDRHYVGSYGYRTKYDYLAWLNTYHGTEFENGAVFVYKTAEYLIDREKWDELTLPTDTRRINNSVIPIKYLVDDENHLITEYRYTNVCPRGKYYGPEYRVAHERIENGLVNYELITLTNQP